MKTIKKIILKIIAFFKSIFGKKDNKKVITPNISSEKKKKVVIPSAQLPKYFYIDEDGKGEIINSLKLIYEKLNDKNINNDSLLCENMELKAFHDNLINDNTEKKYNYIVINNLIKNVENNEISYYLKAQLENLCDNFLDNKNQKETDTNKIIKFKDLFKEIIKESDHHIIKKTNEEYDKVNYITVMTVILDETNNEIEKIDEDINKHKKNKYYYNKKIRKLKKRMLELEKIKEKDLVWNEILILRKDYYTKSKDKYDLLYNDEVYVNLIKKCDLILNKVNQKIVDNKKTNEKKEEIKDDILSFKIYKRYQDLAIARKKILLNEEKFIYPTNKEEIINYLDSIYSDFIKKEQASGFNYERNLIKYKAVNLSNNLTRIICGMTGDGYIPLEHINTPMDYILQDVYNKKQYLELIIHNNDETRSENSKKVDDRINKLLNRETEKTNSKIKIKKKKSS